MIKVRVGGMLVAKVRTEDDAHRAAEIAVTELYATHMISLGVQVPVEFSERGKRLFAGSVEVSEDSSRVL